MLLDARPEQSCHASVVTALITDTVRCPVKRCPSQDTPWAMILVGRLVFQVSRTESLVVVR